MFRPKVCEKCGLNPPPFNRAYPYHLEPLPPAIHLTEEVYGALVEARVTLEGLKASLESFENITQLISIPALQESVRSSNIENIRTTVEGALEDSAKDEKDRLSGNKEALRYREALFEGWRSMDRWGLGNRTLLKIHETLKVKEAGLMRTQQNKIVNEFGEPIYTPPPTESLKGLINNWENFVNTDGQGFHPILRALIAHYQFEAIHPFADGNGRTGRILMVLQLVQDKMIPVPAFYISGYLKEFSDQYKELLLRVTAEKDWEAYLIFMLKGFRLQANRTRETILNIQFLKRQIKKDLRQQLPKIYSSDLLNHIFAFPVTFTGIMEKDLKISRTTATKYLRLLEDKGFLKKRKSGKYVFFDNIALLKVLAYISQKV